MCYHQCSHSQTSNVAGVGTGPDSMFEGYFPASGSGLFHLEMNLYADETPTNTASCGGSLN